MRNEDIHSGLEFQTKGRITVQTDLSFYQLVAILWLQTDTLTAKRILMIIVF